MKLPFGKYAGTPIAEVPLSYLQWMVREKHLCARDAKEEIARREATKEESK